MRSNYRAIGPEKKVETCVGIGAQNGNSGLNQFIGTIFPLSVSNLNGAEIFLIAGQSDYQPHEHRAQVRLVLGKVH